MKPSISLLLLAAAPAWAAELSVAQLVEYQMKEIAAEAAVQVKCDEQEVRLQSRTTRMQFDQPNETYSYSVVYKRLQWTGQCLDGMLHGEGSMVVEKTVRGHGDFRDGVTRLARSGLMVRGTAMGPWRTDVQESLSFKGSDMKTAVIERSALEGNYTWSDAIPPGTYRPDAKGDLRLHRIVFSRPAWSFAPIEGFAPVPQAEIARFKREALAAPAAAPAAPSQAAQSAPPAGATPALRFKARMLDGLTPDGSVARSALPLTPGLDKSIAIVLSSTAAAQLKQLDSLQDALRAQLERETDGRVRTAMQKLINAADHRHLPRELATRLRTRFGKVGTVEDLAAFRAGAYDYAIIVDVASTVDAAAVLADCNNPTTTELVDTQERYRSMLALGLNYIIVDRRLDAAQSYASGKLPVRAPARRFGAGSDNESPAERRALDRAHAFAGLADALQPMLQTYTSFDTTHPPSLLSYLHYTLNPEKQ